MGAHLSPIDLGTGAQVVTAAPGYGHTCALLVDGRVKCWGSAFHGTLGFELPSFNQGDQPNEMSDVLPSVDLGTGLQAIELTAGLAHTCARFDSGKVKCWGDNMSGELGLGDTKPRGETPDEMGDALPFVELSSPVGL